MVWFDVEGGLLRLALSLYLPAFFLSLGLGIVNPILPLYAKSFSVSFGVATLVITAAGVGRLAVDIPVGMMMDRFGRKPVILLGALLASVSGVLSGLASGFFELVAYRLLTGVSMAMWVGARQTMVADSVGSEERGRVMGAFLAFNMMGMSFGPAIGGFVADLWGLRAPFFFYALTSLVTLALSYVLIRESGILTAKDKEVLAVKSKLNYRVFLAGPFLALGFATFANNLNWVARNTLIPFYATFELSLGLSEVGLLLSAVSFSIVLLSFPSGIAADKFGRKITLVPSLALSGISIFLFPSVRDFSQALYASIFTGLASGMGAGVLGTIAADTAPKEWRGVFLSMWRLMADAGAMLGPLIAGFIIDFYGLSSAFYFSASVVVVSAITSHIYIKETLKKK